MGGSECCPRPELSSLTLRRSRPSGHAPSSGRSFLGDSTGRRGPGGGHGVSLWLHSSQKKNKTKLASLGWAGAAGPQKLPTVTLGALPPSPPGFSAPRFLLKCSSVCSPIKGPFTLTPAHRGLTKRIREMAFLPGSLACQGTLLSWFTEAGEKEPGGGCVPESSSGGELDARCAAASRGPTEHTGCELPCAYTGPRRRGCQPGSCACCPGQRPLPWTTGGPPAPDDFGCF